MRDRSDIGDGAWIAYVDDWLTPKEADQLWVALIADVVWSQRSIVLFGRDVLQPRQIGWGGDLPYRYSGRSLEPRPMPEVLAGLCARMASEVGVPFNHALLNRYRDGLDHMGFHADDERELGRNPVIAGVSLGATRTFVMTPKLDRRCRRTWPLRHGSLFVMGGTCQHTWRHAVPKQLSVRGERVNITVRRLLGPPGWREPPGTDPIAPGARRT